MRIAVLALLAVLVVTSGCNAFGGDPATPTLTPAEVPPTPTEEPTGPSMVAPGLTAGNVTDVDRLAEHHAAAIASSRYTWNETTRKYRRTGNGSEAVTISRTAVVRNGTTDVRRSVYHGAAPEEGDQYRYQLVEYRRGDVTYTRWRPDPDAASNYTVIEGPEAAPQDDQTAATAIRTYLDLSTTEVRPIAVGTRDHFLVTGTLNYHRAYGPVEEYEARAIVREDGFVRRLAANFTVTIGEQRLPVEYRYAYSDVGEATLTPPAWLSEARAAHRPESERGN